MRTSEPIARWRNSQGALTQSWSPATERPRANVFALVLAFGFLIPASLALVPLMAAALLVTVALGGRQIVEGRTGFVGLTVACAVATGAALAWVAPNHHWLVDGITGALWGTAVALASLAEIR